jgi:hypothetical protein
MFTMISVLILIRELLTHGYWVYGTTTHPTSLVCCAVEKVTLHPSRDRTPQWNSIREGNLVGHGSRMKGDNTVLSKYFPTLSIFESKLYHNSSTQEHIAKRTSYQLLTIIPYISSSSSSSSSSSRHVLGPEACYGLGLPLHLFVGRPIDLFPWGRYRKIAFGNLPASIILLTWLIQFCW